MKKTSLAQQKYFITGAASGIGKATAELAAREGAQLFLTDINGEALAQVAANITQQGGQVVFYQAANVADYDAIKTMTATITDTFGAMDVVMNIAGISTWGSIDTLQNQHWRDCVEVNLMGPIHVLENLVPPMMAAKKGGHIVNVSSAAGLFGLPWHAPYSASKFGLRGLSEVLRFDLRRHRIGVSLVCPGAVDTGLVQTINIVGVDKNHPDVKKLTGLFQRHAIAPEKAAQAIIKGIKKNKYLVFTSADIAIGHWFQTKLPWTYELAMRVANFFFQKTLGKLQ